MKIAFASDFDGTIFFKEVRSQKTNFLEEDIKAIHEFQQKGGLFGICTGRPLEYVTMFTDQVGINFDFSILCAFRCVSKTKSTGKAKDI